MYLSLQERSSDSSDSEATRRWLGCFRRRHTEPPSDLEAYEVSTEDSETSDEKIQELLGFGRLLGLFSVGFRAESSGLEHMSSLRRWIRRV